MIAIDYVLGFSIFAALSWSGFRMYRRGRAAPASKVDYILAVFALIAFATMLWLAFSEPRAG